MSRDEVLHMLVLELELLIPEAQSLKDKRRVMKTCIERLKNTLNASVVEFGFKDKWQRGGIALSLLSGDKSYLHGRIPKIENLLAEVTGVQLLNLRQEWF